MSATLKYLREDLLGGALTKVDSVLPNIDSMKLQNNTFTKLAVLVGLSVAAKGTWCALKWLAFRLTHTYPSKDPTVLKTRYGEKSWVVVDIHRNEPFALLLAKQGFNIILLGTADRIEIGRDLISSVNPDIEMEEFVVDWEKDQLNQAVYDQLAAKFQYYDISFVITPKVLSVPVEPFSADSKYPVVTPIFLLVSTFLKKLKSRPYRSAIIISSDFRSGKIEKGRSLENAAVTAVDTFASTLEYEVRSYCDLVISKGTEKDAFDCLGVKLVSDN